MLSGPETCVKATDIGKFILLEKTTVRPWVMPAQDAAVRECKMAAQEYASHVRAHELGHRQVNEAVVNSWNQSIAKGFGPVEHCAPTEEEAETMDEADLEVLIRQSAKALQAELDAASDNYDAHNQNVPVECDACPE